MKKGNHLAYQRQIDATDHQIDQLVYELYGLTDAEIKIVEAAKPRSTETPSALMQ